MENDGDHSEANTAWERARTTGSNEMIDKESRWKDWPEALSKVRDLPTWNQFAEADYTSLGALQALLEFFAWQEEPYPSMSTYIKDRLEAPLFEYGSLQSQPRFIRLLRLDLNTPLLPNLGEGCFMVELHLETFPADDHPQYNALSYVWGDPTAKVPILVNDRTFNVTENLLIILSHLRQQEYEEWIWIDAICIDQTNLSEKSVVVRQIPFIYEHAQSTLAWVGTIMDSIGKTDKDALLGITGFKKMIDEIVASPEFNQTYYEDEEDTVSTVNEIRPKEFWQMLRTNEAMVTHFMVRLSEMLKGDNKKYVSQFGNVVAHTLWKRVWIVQEFAHSQDLILLTERHTTSLRNLFYVWVVLFRAILLDSDFGPHLFPPKTQGDIKNMFMMLSIHKAFEIFTETLSLLELLRASGWFKASDSRDKIFALLGLAQDAPDVAIDTDYELEYESICTRLSVKLLGKHGVMIFSCNAGWTEDQAQSRLRLPSWCSDWRRVSYPTLLLGWPNRNVFNAAPEGMTSRWEADQENGRLSMSATLVDTIWDVRACHLPHFDNDPIGPSLLLVQVWWKLRELFSGRIPLQFPSKATYLNEALYCVPIACRRFAPVSSLPHPQDDVQQAHESYEALHKEYWEASKSPEDHRPSPLMRSFVQDLKYMADGRKFFATECGWLGLGPAATQTGDILCIFPTANAPHVLRPLKNGHYLLIGEVYVHGIMYGEYFEQDETPEWQNIILE